MKRIIFEVRLSFQEVLSEGRLVDDLDYWVYLYKEQTEQLLVDLQVRQRSKDARGIPCARAPIY